MEIREYRKEDFPMLTAWHSSRHESPLPECLLPPLGFVVEDEHGACAALFCYQSYGVGVAFLAFAFSRPGTSFFVAKRAFNLCMKAIILACEDTHRLFKCVTLPPIGRVLKSWGFIPDPFISNNYYYYA
jgi:hypothetical protein